MTQAQQAIVKSCETKSIVTTWGVPAVRAELYSLCRTSEAHDGNVFYYGALLNDGSSSWVVSAEVL